eukprot:scaffold5862_cov74-Isochrysis_galbana.AAC.1
MPSSTASAMKWASRGVAAGVSIHRSSTACGGARENTIQEPSPHGWLTFPPPSPTRSRPGAPIRPSYLGGEVIRPPPYLQEGVEALRGVCGEEDVASV